MSTIVTRAGKGSPLTWNEVDNNFTNLNTDKLQSGNTAAALTITSATINGGTITGTALNGTLGATTPSTIAATTISASGVSTFSAGTAGAPAITTTGDTNTGIFFPAADTIAFSEGGVESMRINSSGRLGIGTTNPRSLLDITSTTTDALINLDGGSSASSYLNFRIAGTNKGYIGLGAYTGGSNDNLAYWTSGAGSHLFYTNSALKMTLDASGNLGIGTASPARKLDVNGSIQLPTNNALYIKGSDNYFYADSSNTVEIAAGTSGKINFVTNGASRAILDSSGNLGLGVTPSAWLAGYSAQQIKTMSLASGGGGFEFITSNAFVGTGDVFKYIETRPATAYRLNNNSGIHAWYNAPSGTAGNNITFTQAMTLDASGNLYVGTTTAFSARVNALQTASNLAAGYFINTSSPTGQGVVASYTYAAASGSAIGFILGSGNGSAVTANNLFIYTNGNVVNTNNSYGAISDIKLKENIVDASPKLDDLCKVKVRNYTLISDESKTKQLGVIAQELEEIFPSLIETQADKDVDGNDLGTTTKQVKYSVFVPMLIKALQEQQAMIDELKAKVAALEAA
jgi:hypothetical protein